MYPYWTAKIPLAQYFAAILAIAELLFTNRKSHRLSTGTEIGDLG